jgi:hypothetical protein
MLLLKSIPNIGSVSGCAGSMIKEAMGKHVTLTDTCIKSWV